MRAGGLPCFDLMERMAETTEGAIAAGHCKTVEAGQIIYEAGGNAFDAAIAALLASCVVESTLTSLGGGGFLLAHSRDRQNLLFDFFCQTPRRKRNGSGLDFYEIDVDFGGARQAFHIGLGAIATPGTLAGIAEVHRRLGKLPLSVVAEPAIDYARRGFAVTEFNAYCYQLLQPILSTLPESRTLYAPSGQLLTAGDTFYMADFANFLEEICRNGIDCFYRGEIARQIARDLSLEGHLSPDDLRHYSVRLSAPLTVSYRGYEILTNPPPSSGGILIAFALKLLENADLSDIEWGSDDHLQILAQVMGLTNQARQQDYDRHLYRSDIARNFLDADFIATYGGQLSRLCRQDSKWGSTTHISTLDREGNAASVTSSNGEGSGYVVPNTGIMLNNMLGEADLNPLGFHQWHCDRRLSSMMSPTILLQDGRPKMVLGSGGSNRIRTAIFQVISNLIDFQLPLSEAIKRSRLHWERGILNVEPMGRSLDLTRQVLPPATQVVEWQRQNMFFGGVHGVGVDAEDRLVGAGDLRRAGVAAICPADRL